MSLRSRDIDPLIRNRGFEAGTRHMLHEIVERLGVAEKLIAELAQMMEQMVHISSSMMAVAGNMKNVLDRGRQIGEEVDNDRPNPYDGKS